MAAFDWPGLPHRIFAERVFKRIDSVLSAANQGAKTWTGAAIAVSFARGASSLGGLRLPVIPVPNVGGVNVESHAVQIDSSQAAILHWLGNHPHEVAWLRKAEHVASATFVSTAGCRHGMDEHCASCSRIVFASQENPDRHLGARWLWGWGDEPPDRGVWDEIRKNCRYKWITETPLERSKWEWIEAQYLAALNEPKDGRFMIRASIDDNKFLSDQHKRELIAGYESSPFKKARMTGEPVDAEGATPWGDLGFQRLQEMLKGCEKPMIYEFPLAAAHRSSEKVATLEVMHEPEADETYYLDVDGSAGIGDDEGGLERSKGRDPGGVHVYARRRPRLAARYAGYLVPQVLGHFAGAVAKMYGNALCDVENQGGWGEAVMIGMRDGGHENFAGRDVRAVRPGSAPHTYGFRTDAVTRGLYIGAVQDQILHGGIEVKNAGVIRAALGMRIDKNGKILARYGMHDEDVMLWGRAANWMARNPPEALRPKANEVDWIGKEIEAQLLAARRGSRAPKRIGEAWD